MENNLESEKEAVDPAARRAFDAAGKGDMQTALELREYTLQRAAHEIAWADWQGWANDLAKNFAPLNSKHWAAVAEAWNSRENEESLDDTAYRACRAIGTDATVALSNLRHAEGDEIFDSLRSFAAIGGEAGLKLPPAPGGAQPWWANLAELRERTEDAAWMELALALNNAPGKHVLGPDKTISEENRAWVLGPDDTDYETPEFEQWAGRYEAEQQEPEQSTPKVESWHDSVFRLAVHKEKGGRTPEAVFEAAADAAREHFETPSAALAAYGSREDSPAWDDYEEAVAAAVEQRAGGVWADWSIEFEADAAKELTRGADQEAAPESPRRAFTAFDQVSGKDRGGPGGRGL